MATNKNNSNGNKEVPDQKPDSGNLKFLINAQYLKDLSFENPKAPNSLRQISNENVPKFQIDANVTSRPLNDHGENIFEVELSIKSETKTSDATLFIVEGVYIVDVYMFILVFIDIYLYFQFCWVNLFFKN